MDLSSFLALPTEEVAAIVRDKGPKVCVFPINGTRRWFMLEYGDKAREDPVKAYLDATTKSHIEIYKLFFRYGVDTLITPIFGGELLNRGDEYIKMAVEGMTRLATHTKFLSFYQDYKVHVGFYGDYSKELTNTPYSHLIDLFDQTRKITQANNGYRLFYGVFANDATESVAELSVRYFQKTGKLPTRRDLIELFYGDYIEKADIFIGFEKFTVFDYPLLGMGEENIYFTVAPSLYLNELQLRNILYDHIYLRPIQNLDYSRIQRQDFESMKTYYQDNRESTFGVGEIRGGVWYAITKIQV